MGARRDHDVSSPHGSWPCASRCTGSVRCREQAAYAAGQAAAVAHVAAHELGAAAYAIKAVRSGRARR